MTENPKNKFQAKAKKIEDILPANIESLEELEALGEKAFITKTKTVDEVKKDLEELYN